MNQEEYLKTNLPSAPYYLEQTGIAEIAPRPTPITLSLLERIYRAQGPIAQAYRRLRISYVPRKTLRILGNQLFVDREEELKTLLPAFSYFASRPWKPKLANLQGILRSFRNIAALQFLSPAVDRSVVLRLDAALKHVTETEVGLETALSEFERAYAVIFEINLKAEKAVERLALALGKDALTPAEILASSQTFAFYRTPQVVFDESHWRGNSLELGDMSDFRRQTSRGQQPSVTERWQAMKEMRRRYLQLPISEALFYHDLREFGRWLTVGHINRLRSLVFAKAASCGFRKSENALFATFDEIHGCLPAEAVCEQRRHEYESYDVWDLPTILRSDQAKVSNVERDTSNVEHKPKGIGLSPGLAQGRLIVTGDLASAQGEVVLYTKLLTPDLAVHLDKVQAIVSEQGSVLSHLAILCREKGLPLVARFDLHGSGIKFGDKVSVDGTKGTVRVV